MLIDVPIYIGYDGNRSNEGRVLLDSLRAYLDILGEPDQRNAGDIRAVADLTLTLFGAVLTHTEQLGECQEPDGRGGYQTIYRPVPALTSDQTDLHTGAEEGRGV